MNSLDLVRKYYSCYETKDRKTLEQLLSDDFVFDSPVDDHIDRTTYFRKCWPNSENILAYHFKTLCADGDKVFTRYEVDWKADPSSNFPAWSSSRSRRARSRGYTATSALFRNYRRRADDGRAFQAECRQTRRC